MLVSAAEPLAGTSRPRRAAGMWRQDMSALELRCCWQAIAVVDRAWRGAVRWRARDVLGPATAGTVHGLPQGGDADGRLQVVVSSFIYPLPRQYDDLRPFVKLFGEQWVLLCWWVGVGAPMSEELRYAALMSALARSRLGPSGGRGNDELWTALHCGNSWRHSSRCYNGLFFSWCCGAPGALGCQVLPRDFVCKSR